MGNADAASAGDADTVDSSKELSNKPESNSSENVSDAAEQTPLPTEDAPSDDDEEEAADDDAYLAYLTREYQKYRIWTLLLAIVGFSLILLTIGLQQAGVLEAKVFNLMMSVANMFIVFMLVLAFTRTRPFRKKVKSYDKYYVSIVDPEAEDGVRMEQRNLPDMDDFFKIFERRARTELIPDTDEYKKLRKTWISLYIAAAVVAVVSIIMYLAAPSLSLISTLLLLVAFVLVIVAFYFDRTKMRPLRTKWAKDNYGLAEFQVRDRMREMEDGSLKKEQNL